MQSSFKKIAIGTVFFVLTIIFAVVGYLCFGWSLIEAIYMVVITVFGVGYGEVRPIDTASEKAFTIIVILAGTSSALYIVGGFVQMIAEGEINRAFDAQRKKNTISNLNNHVIICGFGQIAQMIAIHLVEAAQDFVIIDNNGDRIALEQWSAWRH